MLKGIFKDASSFIQILLLFFFFFSGAIAGELIGTVVVMMKNGFSVENFNTVQQNLQAYPEILREIHFFSSLGGFVFPSLIAAYLFSGDYKNYLKIDTPIQTSVVLWAALSMFVAIPCLDFIAYYNQQIHFPEYLKPLEVTLRTQEENMTVLSEAMMQMNSLWDLILGIVVVAIFAAIGEEFLFRGVFQNIFGRFIRNKHWVIWIAATVFSLAHFQFFGFIPRLLLGAYLGYLLYFTKNIWVPVVAHFTNNFIIIMCYWIFRDKPEQLEKIDNVSAGSSWWLALVSLIIFVIIFVKIRKESRLQDFSS